VFGGHDEIGPADDERDQLEQCPSVTLVTIGDAGHFSLNEKPRLPRFSSRLWEFAAVLRSVARRTIVNLMVQYSKTVDRAFAALADPTRRAVLERLGAGSATISELAEPFGMSLTGMKKHIRLLEEALLVTTEKVGRVRRCTLVPYAFEGISTWLQRLDRFAQVVERTKGAA
jgi:DNA-binding transcriptional ArsR family regulator